MNGSKKWGEPIFDLLSGGRRMTSAEIMAELGIGNRLSFAKGVYFVRHALSDVDEVNLVVIRDNDGKHRYELVTSSDAADPWRQMRVKSVRAQVDTIRAVTSTFPEREARIWARGLTRILEDLDDLNVHEAV